jgi:hypothetical protein
LPVITLNGMDSQSGKFSVCFAAFDQHAATLRLFHVEVSVAATE